MQRIFNKHILRIKAFSRTLSNESIEKPVSNRVRQIQKEADEQRERLQWRSKENPFIKDYNSKLHYINNEEQTSDYITMMQQPFDFNLKRIFQRRQEKKDRHMQQFVAERHEILGPDLATAHFLLFRGGAIKFKHKPDEWMRANEHQEFDLPTKYQEQYKLIAVDCTDMNLYYEGLANIVALRELKYLSFRNNQNFDDWSLDRVSGAYLPQLEELDVSNTKITHNSFSCLYRLSALKKIIITQNEQLNFKLACAMLEECLPQLQIVTVSLDNNKN